MGISVLLRSEGGNCLQDLNNFYSHLRENCVQAIENSLNVLATKKLMSFSFSLQVNIFILLPLFPIYSKTVTACSRA